MRVCALRGRVLQDHGAEALCQNLGGAMDLANYDMSLFPMIEWRLTRSGLR